MLPKEIAACYQAGETIAELVRSTGQSQRRVRAAITAGGVPFRSVGRVTGKPDSKPRKTGFRRPSNGITEAADDQSGRSAGRAPDLENRGLPPARL